MHFNDRRNGDSSRVPFHFRVSDQKLFKEIIASINADYQEMIKYPQKAKKRFCLICDVAY